MGSKKDKRDTEDSLAAKLGDDQDTENLKAWGRAGRAVSDTAGDAANAVTSTLSDQLDRVPPLGDRLFKGAVTKDKPDPYKTEPMSKDEVASFAEFKGNGKDMGPPATLDVAPGQFRPTPAGKSDSEETFTAGALPDTAQGEGYDKFKNALRGAESSQDYGARNGNASGAYQFIPKYWDGFVKDEFGHSIEDMMPKKGDTPEVLAEKKAEQDKVFDKYYESQVIPWVRQVKDQGLGKGMSDVELAALFHRDGADGGEKYLRTGKGANDNDGKNSPIRDYLSKVAVSAGANPTGTQPSFSATTSPTSSGDRSTRSIADLLTPGENPVDTINSYKTPQAQQASYDLRKAADSGNEDVFAKELRQVRQDYLNEKDSIARRELASTLADALTKMGAGLYGLKSGVDMSHINTGTHDFQKDTALAQEEYKTNLGDLRSRREEDIKKRENAANMAYKQDESLMRHAEFANNAKDKAAQVRIAAYTAVTGNDRAKAQELHNQAQENYQVAQLAWQRDKENIENQRKLQEAWNAKKAVAVGKIAGYINTPEYRKDPDKGASSIQAELESLGVTPDKAKAAAYEKQWFGLTTGAKDPMDIVYSAGQAIDALAPNPLHQQGVTVKNSKTGQTATLPTPEAAAEATKRSNGEWQKI